MDKLKAEFEELYYNTHNPKDCSCGNVGWTVGTHINGYGEAEPVQIQCEYCYCEPDSRFNCEQRFNALWDFIESHLQQAEDRGRVEENKHWIKEMEKFAGMTFSNRISELTKGE
jgi:hypothetical protein